MRRASSAAPVVITTARDSAEAEYEHRRRKYALMMGIRALAVLGAALCYQVSLWASLAFALAGTVLPWCAVIIANDGPPKKKRAVMTPVVSHERALPGAGPHTIDATADERTHEPADDRP